MALWPFPPLCWAQRNPLLLFVFVGLFLLRFEARRLFGLLFHEPPRNTRVERAGPFQVYGPEP